METNDSFAWRWKGGHVKCAGLFIDISQQSSFVYPQITGIRQISQMWKVTNSD